MYLLTQLAGDALRAHRLCLLALRLCLPRNLVCPNIQLLPIESLKWKKWAFLPLLHLLPPRNPDLISLICMLIINLTRTSLLTRIRTRMRIPRRLFTTRFPSKPPLKSPRAPKRFFMSKLYSTISIIHSFASFHIEVRMDVISCSRPNL